MDNFIGVLGMHCGIALAMNMGMASLYTKLAGVDQYADQSSDNLKKLVSQLEDLNVSTDYDLLLKSEVYDKKYKVEINKEQLPHLAESKYIFVPSYTYNRDKKDTSILQEHIVGSKEYILSLGSPKKVLRKAYSGA